ncbi:uncharacterized protein [Nicotiana tomentosiformis]|uniref:uncharacterized protein n=1 Tax=Nicotiana tomentosiformis TaxID=4098 RepID=UPI00388C62A8
MEDAISFGNLEIPKKSSPSKASEPSSSPKLVDQFPAPSAYPDRKGTIVFSFPEDAQVLSSPVAVASYLRCLVTEDDQAKMNEVDAPYLFNKVQQALNRDNLKQLEARVRELTEKRDAFKLFSEQLKSETKDLRAELEVARKDHADLVDQEKKRKKKGGSEEGKDKKKGKEGRLKIGEDEKREREEKQAVEREWKCVGNSGYNLSLKWA